MDFQRHLRYWRQVAKLSQMQLALECDLSPKHLNQLENGKTKPTRETILKLANQLKLSFCNTNNMLIAAGFAAEYRKSNLLSKELAFTRYAIQRTIEQHNPFPAIVTDPAGNFINMNDGAKKLMMFLLPLEALASATNAYEVYFSEQGFRPYIKNWDETSCELLHHLEREILSIPPGEPGYDLITRLEKQYELPKDWRTSERDDQPSPIFNFHFEKDGQELQFFSTFTAFGTPRDISLQDVRIESFFPADESTRVFCENL